MRKFRTVTFPSQQQAWVSPGSTKLEFKGWIPNADGNGNRYIIDGFEIHAQMNVTTTVGATDARDLWRLIGSLTIQQVDGTNRFNEIPGDALRVLSYQLLGSKDTREQFNVAVGASQAITCSFYVPLTRPLTEDEYEFCIPVETFQLIRVGMAQTFTLATNVCTINSGNYWVAARCHVEPKDKLKSYAQDLVTTNDFPQAGSTQVQINVGPGKVHDVVMYVPGAGGGLALTTGQITNVNIVELYPQSQNVFPDLANRYALDHDEEPGLFGTTNQSPTHTNPFIADPADGSGANAATAPRALALVSATGNRPDEGPTVPQLTVNLIESAAPGGVPRLITRTVVPRSSKLDRAQGTAAGRGKKSAHVDRSDGRSVAPSAQQYYSAQLR